MKKLVVIFVLFMVLALSACGSTNDSTSDERTIQSFIEAYESAGVEVDKEEKPLFTILGAVDGVIFYMDSNKVAIYEYSTEKALDDEKTNDEMLNDWLSNGKFLLETNNQEAKDIFSSVN